jgi:hypothetical protein
LAVDTPAKIAILGAGPIGLEAALYARFLGYEVEILQSSYGPSSNYPAFTQPPVPLWEPFGARCSSLGLRALAAHDEHYHPPSPDERLTVQQWYERYVLPLKDVDLIADHIRPGVWPHSIGKVELTKTDCGDAEHDRGAWDFRIHAYCHNTEEPKTTSEIIVADIIFDCTGLASNPLGHGGIDAIGETLRVATSLWMGDPRSLWTAPPDVHNRERNHFAGATTLIVGSGSAAYLSAPPLAELVDSVPGTKVIWVTRKERSQQPDGPIDIALDDSNKLRRDVFSAANEAALSNKIRWLPGIWIEEITKLPNARTLVRLSGEEELELEVDFIISATGDHPRWDHTRELQLDICPITDAPRPFSEYLLKRPSPYSVEYPAANPQALITSEPNYYVLGSKSFGRMPGFLYQHGLRQIRDVFTIIGDRADLDLYAQMK